VPQKSRAASKKKDPNGRMGFSRGKRAFSISGREAIIVSSRIRRGEEKRGGFLFSEKKKKAALVFCREKPRSSAGERGKEALFFSCEKKKDVKLISPEGHVLWNGKKRVIRTENVIPFLKKGMKEKEIKILGAIEERTRGKSGTMIGMGKERSEGKATNQRERVYVEIRGNRSEVFGEGLVAGVVKQEGGD